MEKLFRKHFWAVHAAGVIVLAILAAAVFNIVVATIITPYSVVALPPMASDRGPADDEDFTFVPTNLFGDRTPPAPADPCAEVTCEEGEFCNPETGECELSPEELDDEDEDDFSDGRCVESNIALVLAGTIVSETNSIFSLAVMHDPTENKTRFGRIGSVLLDDAEVVDIRRNNVVLRVDGREECLRPGTLQERQQRRARAEGGQEDQSGRGALSAAASARTVAARRRAAAAAPANEEAAPPTASRGGSLEDRIQNAVQQAAPNEYNVERDVLQEVMNDQSALQRQAPQATPTYRNGRPAGFRLTNLRNDSIFSQLGVRNGDILRAVNGQVLDSPQRAMSLYEGLTSQNEIKIEVERRGRTHTLTYRLR